MTLKNLIISLIVLVTLAGCQGKQTTENTPQTKDQFAKVINYLESTGDFINSPAAPAVIDAKKVFAMLGTNMLVIDTRSEAEFNAGHIEGAVNVGFNNLIYFFENSIDPTAFDNITIACHTGQSAGFATSLLRMLGYKNTYSLKWGMSSWTKSVADTKWSKNIGSKYQDKLSTEPTPKPEMGAYPQIYSTDTLGYAIVRKRAIEMLNNGFLHYAVKNDAVFEQPESFFIVNYWPEALYNKGHIPGAIQYTPKKSLSRTTFLQTLPTDKTIVPYCFTGQHSAYVTAYLAMLGYNAKSLLYGANGIMHQLMVDDIGHHFSDAQIMEYPLSTETNAKMPKVKQDKTQQPAPSAAGGC